MDLGKFDVDLMGDKGFEATLDIQQLNGSDAIIIMALTRLTDSLAPDLTTIVNSAKASTENGRRVNSSYLRQP
jgi:UDP-N-acetyl-D-mannosaminuronate dehydrogenase